MPPEVPNPFGAIGYASAHKQVRNLTRLLAASVVLDGCQLIVSLLEGIFFPGFARSEALSGGQSAFALIYALTSFAAFIVFLAAAVAFCLWVYRANANARALGAEDMDYTPGWAVGWFFVPLAHLVVPLKVVKELCLASDPEAGEDWKSRPVSGYLNGWWTAWILSQIANRVDFRFALSADPGMQALAPWVSALACLPNMAAGALAWIVVKHVAALQIEKAKRKGLA